MSNSRRYHVPRPIRAAIVARGVCALCGGEERGEEDVWHIDHIKPRANGGTDDLSNLQLAHASCNLLKSDKENTFKPYFNPRVLNKQNVSTILNSGTK